MFTIDFIEQYARNMYQSLQEGRHDLNELDFDCEFCPLRAECTEDVTTHGCARFLQRALADGDDFIATTE